MKKIFHFLFTISLFLLFTQCRKSTEISAIDNAYQLIVNKNWYLDFSKTTIGTKSTTLSYVGEPTYFIHFSKDSTTTDADGLTGNFTITKPIEQLQLNVVAKTGNNNSIKYNYLIESILDNHMSLSKKKDSVLTIYYFSNK